MSFAVLAAAVALACAWAAVQLFRHLPRGVAALLTAGLLLGAIGVPGLLLGAIATEPRKVDPTLGSYETSNACVKCHPDHHRTWSRTYHRTMTQDVSPAAVLGDFDDASVRFKGHEGRMSRVGDDFYMEVLDPEWESAGRAGRRRASGEPPRRSFRVDRLVGSHIEQVYLSRQENGAYFILPFVWNQMDQAWLPLGEIFLNPDAAGVHLPGYAQLWNSSCIFCHNTRPNPGLRPGAGRANASWEVELPEMGIACEACHGPADTHVRVNRNPVRRQLLIEEGGRDRTIVNADRMKKQGSLRACGRCHGKWMAHPELTQQVLERGELFIPGRHDLEDFFELPMIRPADYDPAKDRNYFWPDATPRATAMEFQGNLLSPCFERGKLTCLSCHSMHAADPSDQLRFPEDPDTPEHESDEQCTQCHPRFVPEEARLAHTRHEADSVGSRCVACHMPYQSYGLLQAQRSHRIQSPDPGKTASDSLPNACNQCHVDRSLAWTAEVLAEWGLDGGAGAAAASDADPFSGDREHVSETLLQLVRGHGLSRAIAVQMLGREDAREAAPGLWRAPFLIDALDDSYPAVRQNAYRSLRKLPGFEDAVFTYFADPELRAAQVAPLRVRWEAMAREHADAVPADVPLGPDGLPDPVLHARLRASRDDTELNIAE